MRSCQMIGVENPDPGILVFHRMFSVLLQRTGGVAPTATPAPEVPRHVGHAETAACEAVIPVTPSAKAKN